MVLWVMTQAIMILVMTCLIYLPILKQKLNYVHTHAHILSSGGLGCPKAF